MDRDGEKVHVSSACYYMNRHTVYQQNGLKSLMNYNDRDTMDMDDNLQNRYVISRIGLRNIHNLPRYNKSSNLSDMNMGVKTVI